MDSEQIRSEIDSVKARVKNLDSILNEDVFNIYLDHPLECDCTICSKINALPLDRLWMPGVE